MVACTVLFRDSESPAKLITAQLSYDFQHHLFLKSLGMTKCFLQKALGPPLVFQSFQPLSGC